MRAVDIIRAKRDGQPLSSEAIDNFVGQKLPSSALQRNERMSRSQTDQGAPADDAGEPTQIDPSNRYVEDEPAQERM